MPAWGAARVRLTSGEAARAAKLRLQTAPLLPSLLSVPLKLAVTEHTVLY